MLRILEVAFESTPCCHRSHPWLCFLITKSDVSWGDGHELHWKGKHHKNDKHRDNAQSLRHGVSLSDSVDFKAEEVDADLYDSVEDADEGVDEDPREQDGIEEQLDVDWVVLEYVMLMVRW